MKAYLEIVKVDVKDIVTASVAPTPCEYEACPGMEFDPYAIEG